jgi:hypothetical protein
MQPQQRLSENLTVVKKAFEPIFIEPWNFLCVMAPRGSGKTVLALQVCFKKYLLNPAEKNCKIGFYGPTKSDVKEIVEPIVTTYINQIDNAGAKGKVTYNRTTGECKVYFDGIMDIRRLYISSYEKGQELRGKHLKFMVMDEASLLPRDLYYEVIGPILAHEGRRARALYIGTPKPGVGDLFIENFEKGLPENKKRCWEWLGKYVKGEAKEDEIAIDQLRWKSYWYKASETDLLDPIHLAAEKSRYPEEIYNMEYECDYKSRVGKGYSFANRLAKYNDHIHDGVNYDYRHPVFTAWDLGHSCDTVCWIYQVIDNKQYFLDYYEDNDKHISMHLTAVMSKGYPIRLHFLPHDCTHKHVDSWETTYQVFKNFGCDAKRLKPPESKGQDINNAIAMICGSYFHKTKCSKGLEHLRRYELESDKHYDKIYPMPTSRCKAHWDCADALRYAWQSLKLCNVNLNPFEVQYPRGTGYAENR